MPDHHRGWIQEGERGAILRIFSGIQKSPQKIIIYGTEGIGKTTMAAQFPNALFIDTEESTKFLDVRRTEAPQSFQELLAQIDYVRQHPDLCDTLIVDTLDWALFDGSSP